MQGAEAVNNALTPSVDLRFIFVIIRLWQCLRTYGIEPALPDVKGIRFVRDAVRIASNVAQNMAQGLRQYQAPESCITFGSRRVRKDPSIELKDRPLIGYAKPP